MALAPGPRFIRKKLGAEEIPLQAQGGLATLGDLRCLAEEGPRQVPAPHLLLTCHGHRWRRDAGDSAPLACILRDHEGGADWDPIIWVDWVPDNDFFAVIGDWMSFWLNPEEVEPKRRRCSHATVTIIPVPTCRYLIGLFSALWSSAHQGSLRQTPEEGALEPWAPSAPAAVALLCSTTGRWGLARKTWLHQGPGACA